jgi:SAM-dependent methyltransferase
MTPVHPVVVKARKASAEEFVASSIIRFGRHRDYIQEKILVDYFAIHGNELVAKGLEKYIKENLKHLQGLKKIKLLDVGPAIGALSTLVALQSLSKFGLMEKTSVYMIDVSENVIDLTQSGNFFFPTSLVDVKLKSKILQKIKNSHAVVGSASEMPWKDERFDITLACFLFHHLHNEIKAPVANEISRTLAPNGFLGIAEEWFDNYDRDYAKYHKEDKIPLAYESIVSYKGLLELLPEFNEFFSHDKENREQAYVFCGTKKRG